MELILNETIPEECATIAHIENYNQKDKLFYFLPNGITNQARIILDAWFSKDNDLAVFLIGESIDGSRYPFAHVIEKTVDEPTLFIADRSNIVRYISDAPELNAVIRTIQQMFSNIGCGLSKEL